MEDVLKNYTLCEDRHAILQIEQSNPFTNNTKRRPCDSSVKTARPPEDNKWTHSQHRGGCTASHGRRTVQTGVNRLPRKVFAAHNLSLHRCADKSMQSLVNNTTRQLCQRSSEGRHTWHGGNHFLTGAARSGSAARALISVTCSGTHRSQSEEMCSDHVKTT